jgi:hypothetical protein
MRVQITRRAKIEPKAKSARDIDHAHPVEKPADKPEREQYEYQMRVMDADSDLTEFGKDGWICFAVVPRDSNDPGSKQASFYFRRKK